MGSVLDRLGDYSELLILAAVLIARFVGALKKAQAKRSAEISPGAAEALEESGLVTTFFEQAREQVLAIAVAPAELRREAAELAERLEGAASGAPVEALIEVLRCDLPGRLDRLHDGTEALVEIVTTLPPGPALERLQADDLYERVIEGIERAQGHLLVLRQLAAWRSEPALGQVLGDADALAASLLGSFQRFCGIHEIDFPPQRPICAPAAPEHESIWFDLLPAAHPVIFVPEDFADHLSRWASVPHEVGHLIWRAVPNLEAELRAALDLAGYPHLPRVHRGQLVGVERAFLAWLPEMFADLAGTVMLGPGALRGMVHVFEGSGAAQIGTRDGETFAEHPPAQLRILWAEQVLDWMGHTRLAGELVASWQAVHGSPEHVELPIRGGRVVVQVPIEGLFQRGREILHHIYSEPLEALGGYELRSIPGMELTGGRFARVRRRARALAGGAPFNDDPPIVLAAALEAQAMSPLAAPQIAAGVRRAILGLGTGERRVADPHYGPISPGGAGQEIFEAFVLSLVLPRGPRGL